MLEGCATAQCRLLMQAAPTFRPKSATALLSSSLSIASRESCFGLACMELPCTTNPLRCLHNKKALRYGRGLLNTLHQGHQRQQAHRLKVATSQESVFMQPGSASIT